MTFEDEVLDRFHTLLGWQQSQFVRDCAKLIQASDRMVEAEPLTIEEIEARNELITASDKCKENLPWPA